MANFNPWVPFRRNQKRFSRNGTLAAVFAAAASSFAMGVMMPLNLRVSHHQAMQILAIQPPPPETTIPDVRPVKAAVTRQVEGAQKTISQWQEARFSVVVPARFRGTTLTQANLPSQEKVIALTFDDGPWPESTEKILDILKQNNVPATFFWVGKHLKAHPEIGKKVAAAGHAIGNHTWSHQYYKYNEKGAANEIDRTATLIEELTGIKTTLFRPPGGMLTNGLVTYAHQKNYAVIMWSADSMDWRSSAKSLQDNVSRNANSGGIVLLHDGGGNRSKTVEALPKILEDLKKQGYKFVTVPELLQMQDREMKQQELAKKSPASPN